LWAEHGIYERLNASQLRSEARTKTDDYFAEEHPKIKLDKLRALYNELYEDRKLMLAFYFAFHKHNRSIENPWPRQPEVQSGLDKSKNVPGMFLNLMDERFKAHDIPVPDWRHSKGKVVMSDEERRARGISGDEIRTMMKFLGKDLAVFNLYPRLRTISALTLIIRGNDDPTPLNAVEMIRDSIPGATMKTISRSGHFPFIEQPEAFFNTVRQFLNEQQ